jgi:molybdate transport system regulatory protein
MSEIRVRSKVWLEYRGLPLLGGGRYRLLTALEGSGSINAAARTLGISYRKAWSQLQAMEEHAPFALFERRAGGKGGGATLLTAEARLLLHRFQELREQVHRQVDRAFEEHFATWP